MNLSETAKILGLCSSFDNRKDSDAAAIAWQRVLKDVSYQDAEEAVYEYYSRETEWIKPGHIKDEVRRIRARRSEGVDAALTFVYEGDPDDIHGYISALRGHGRAIGDGRELPPAPQLTRGVDMLQIENTFKTVQAPPKTLLPSVRVPESPRTAALLRARFERMHTETVDAEIVQEVAQ